MAQIVPALNPRPIAFLAALVFSLVWLSGDAVGGPEKQEKISIPEIARIGKIQIGYSTQNDLEKHWGEGKTITGGHSNSGRLWRVKGTRWILHTDGFEYSKRGGLLVDQLDLYEDPGLIEDRKLMSEVPFTRLSKKDFAWIGKITPGMAKNEVMQILKGQSWPIMATTNGCKISVEGSHALQNHIRKKTWEASFAFTNDRLRELTLEAIGEFRL